MHKCNCWNPCSNSALTSAVTLELQSDWRFSEQICRMSTFTLKALLWKHFFQILKFLMNYIRNIKYINSSFHCTFFADVLCATAKYMYLQFACDGKLSQSGNSLSLESTNSELWPTVVSFVHFVQSDMGGRLKKGYLYTSTHIFWLQLPFLLLSDIW